MTEIRKMRQVRDENGPKAPTGRFDARQTNPGRRGPGPLRSRARSHRLPVVADVSKHQWLRLLLL